MIYAVLLQNGRHVGFRNIIAERAITEEDMSIRAWRKLPMPLDDALGYFFNLVLVDGLIKAGEQHAVANAEYRLARYFTALNWNGEIDASFQKKLVKNILLGSTLY